MNKKPSFWQGEERITPTNIRENIKTDLIHHNDIYTHNQLEQKINDLLWGIESSDYQKSLLLEEYMKLRDLWEKGFDFQANPDVLKINEEMVASRIVMNDQSRFLELRLGFILPYFSKNVTNRTSYYARLKKTYQQPIIKSLRELAAEFTLKEEKCFILITQYMPNYIVRDLDNRFHSLIFNAMRAANIIKNDDWKNLSYMENGHISNNGSGFTNILIGNEKHIIDMLNYNEQITAK